MVHVVGLERTVETETYPSLGVACDPSLVFTSPSPTSASSSQAQAIRTYASSLSTIVGGLPVPPFGGQPPSSSYWVAGPASFCAARVEVTNLTGHDLTLSSANVILMGAPIANTYKYHLLDVCNLNLPGAAGVCGYNSQSPSAAYIAQINLGAGSAGTVFPGQIVRGAKFGPQFLAPSLCAQGW